MHTRLRHGLPDKTSAQVGYLVKRLRVHKLIKKVGQRYKYYNQPIPDLNRAKTMSFRSLSTHETPGGHDDRAKNQGWQPMT